MILEPQTLIGLGTVLTAVVASHVRLETRFTVEFRSMDARVCKIEKALGLGDGGDSVFLRTDLARQIMKEAEDVHGRHGDTLFDHSARLVSLEGRVGMIEARPK